MLTYSKASAWCMGNARVHEDPEAALRLLDEHHAAMEPLITECNAAIGQVRARLDTRATEADE